MKVGRVQLLRLAVAALMLILIVRYVHKLDWHAIVQSTESASIPLLALSALGNLPLIWLKALRMKLLIGNRVRTGKLMGFFVTSYAADNLVMSQAGLGVRVAMLHRESVPLATAVTTQALEKVLEAIGLAILTLPLLGTQHLAPRLRTPLEWCLLAGGIGVVLLGAFALLGSSKLRFLRKVADTARLLRSPLLAGKVLALTMAAWLVEVLMVMSALAALHYTLPPLTASILVLLAVNIAALIPGLPANVGPFEVACMLALGTFGVKGETVLGFALLYHALHTIPVTLAGLPGMNRLTKLRRNEVDSSPEGLQGLNRSDIETADLETR